MPVPPKYSKVFKLTLKISVSILLIGYLAIRVDWNIILRSLLKIDLHLYILSTFIAFTTIYILAAKYYILIRKSSISLGINSLAKINLISEFYSLFFPSAIGKEAVRWYRVTRNKNGRALFFTSTLFERLNFIFVLLLFSIIPLNLYGQNKSINTLRNHLTPILLISLLLIIVAFAYYVIPSFRRILFLVIGKIIKFFKLKLQPENFLSGFILNNPNISLYASTFFLSLLWQLIFLMRLFCLFQASDLPIGYFDVAWMGSLVLLLQVLPISFGGIGIREGAYAYFFSAFNLPPEKGVMIGILFFSQMLILAIVGGLLDIFD